MTLTVWTEHGPGYRSDVFFARIAETLGRTDCPAAYVVPNTAWKKRCEALCLPHCNISGSLSGAGPGCGSGLTILFGDKIMTLAHWLGQIAAPRGAIVSPAQRNRMLAQLMTTFPLAYFRAGKSPFQHADFLAHEIEAALGAGISPEQLHLLAADFGQEREQDLAMVMVAYRRALTGNHQIDPAQIPELALQALEAGRPLPHRQLVVDVGIQPPPIVWKILHTLATRSHDLDLHVIIPEMHRHVAEGRLGVAAREIDPGEWVPTSGARMELYRAPHPGAQYRWMAGYLHMLRGNNTAPAAIGLMSCDPDPTFWLEACMDQGFLRPTSLPLRLEASPVSAPWHDNRVWDHAPQSAILMDWVIWWKSRMAPDACVQDLSRRIKDDSAACRLLQDIARWDEVWMRCMSIVSGPQAITRHELQSLVTPMLQDRTPSQDMSDIYTDITFATHVGDRLSHLLVLDATQDLLPRATPSPFFRLAAAFPQDPNARLLSAAFPNSDAVLQNRVAAWQRLRGATGTITGIYSQNSDSRSELFPSPFFDVAAQDAMTVLPEAAGEQATAGYLPQPSNNCLLNAADTIAHVRDRMRDHTFSITELETFAECPFRHFAQYILGITIPDEDTPDIPARDEGKIIHRLLEQYYRRPVPDLVTMSEGERRTRIAHHLTDILSTEIHTTTPLKRIQTDRLVALGTAAILRDCADTERLGPDALHPAHLEWKFGYGENPPLMLDAGTGKPVAIRGKVDRIDIHPRDKRLLLMDYKNYEADPIIGDIQKGLHLQIPLYLMAVQRAFVDHVVLGGLLYDLPHAERRHGIARKHEAGFLGISGRPKSLVKDETWDELLDAAGGHAVRYAEHIRSAQIALTPHDCDHCDWKDLLPWDESR